MTEPTIKIRRWYNSDCTLGRLSFGGFHCFTLELPFRDNALDISCIVPGTYRAYIYDSPTNGRCIQLDGVPGRTMIQIHAGNYTRDILGCILVGESIRYLDSDNIPDVTSSRLTLDRLLSMLPDGVFYVEVGP